MDMGSVTQFMEQLRGWLSTSLLGVIAYVTVKGMALLLKSQIDNRRLTVEERKQEREGYGPLIASMQEEIDRITNRHHDCEERMNRMEAELNGYRKQILIQSANAVILTPVSPMVHDAAQRVLDIVNDQQE